jgi:hypothetical protein
MQQISCLAAYCKTKNTIIGGGDVIEAAAKKGATACTVTPHASLCTPKQLLILIPKVYFTQTTLTEYDTQSDGSSLEAGIRCFG